MSEEEKPGAEAQEPQEKPAEEQTDGQSPPAAGRPSEDDLEAELNDRATARQRALLNQFVMDAVALMKDGQGNVTSAHSAVSYSGVNIHLGDNFGTRRPAISRLATGPIDAALLERSARTFAEPACFGRLHELVLEQKVVVVFAPRGSGGTTLALNVLQRVCQAVRKLEPDLDIRKLDVKKLEPQTGYLMDAPPLDRLSSWRDFHLEVLAEQFESNGNRLIISTPSDGREVETALGGYVVRADAPAPESIIRAHLEVAAEQDPALQVEEFLADIARQGLLTSLEPGASIYHMVELAEEVVKAFTGSVTFPQIRSVLDGRRADQFETWFAQQETADQQALVIALAVLHGLPWEWVAQAAHQLVELASPPEPAGDEIPRPASLLSNGQTRRLEHARAELVSADLETEHGRLAVTTARFRDDRMPYQVLRHVWNEFGDAHGWLLEWLRGYASSPRMEERVRAAIAVGQFACFSFERVLREVLLPWAESPDYDTRMMAAVAFAVPGTDQELGPLVARLLQDWASQEGHSHRQWTAARTMGLGLGLVSPGRAFNLLRTAVSVGDYPVVRASCQSLIEMFVNGDPQLRSRLLDQLLAWTDLGARRQLVRPGQECFLRMANDLRVEGDERRRPWPALLWLASQSAPDRDRIVALWQRVLWTPKIGRIARAVLLDWAELAGEEQSMRTALADLCLRSATGERERANLSHYLARWRVTNPKTAAVADEILDRLKGEHGDGNADRD